MTSDHMLTLKEVAETLHISRSSAQRLVRGEAKGTPRLPSISIGSRVLVRRETLESFIRDLEGVQSHA